MSLPQKVYFETEGLARFMKNSGFAFVPDYQRSLQSNQKIKQPAVFDLEALEFTPTGVYLQRQ